MLVDRAPRKPAVRRCAAPLGKRRHSPSLPSARFAALGSATHPPLREWSGGDVRGPLGEQCLSPSQRSAGCSRSRLEVLKS